MMRHLFGKWVISMMNDAKFEIRLWSDSDSIEELTALLHRAYAKLGKLGLNYTAVDQSPEVTQRRMDHGFKEIALDTAKHLIDLYTRYQYQWVDFVQWSGKTYRSVVLRKILVP